MKNRIIFMIYLIGSVLALTLVNAEGPGTTSANFLKAGQGNRALAMGEAYTALGNDIDTLNWNPAGLYQLDSPTAHFSHAFWFQDMGLEYLAYGMPLGPLGTVAAGMSIFHAGTITETLENEQGDYVGEGKELNPVSFNLIGGYSQKLIHVIPTNDPFLKNVLVGANLKIITENLNEDLIFGGAIDLGLIWREIEEIAPQKVTQATTGFISDDIIKNRDQGWRLGLVVQNLGMSTDEWLPINLKFGMGYVKQELFTSFGRGTVAIDMVLPNDNDMAFSFGGEYAYITTHSTISCRAGYKLDSKVADFDSLAGFSTGFGIAVVTQLLKYQVDYAFVPFGELGNTHRLALSIGFLPSINVSK